MMTLKRRLLFLKRDSANFIRYGLYAPRHSQTIFVDPQRCGSIIDWNVGRQRGLLRSGFVHFDPYWADVLLPLSESSKIAGILRHWRDGLPWEKTRSYQNLMRKVDQQPGIEGCYSESDVRRRYERLDQIFETARRTGKLLPMTQINKGNLRETGGVLMHIGEKGQPIFGGSGFHRFCIAVTLKISLPCMVGAVHVSALPYYRQLTLPPGHSGRIDVDNQVEQLHCD